MTADAFITYGLVVLAALYVARPWLFKAIFKTSTPAPAAGCGSCSSGACGSCPVARVPTFDQSPLDPR